MLRHLSNGELCSFLTRERHASPLIEELCERLEQFADRQPKARLGADRTEKDGDCPVCRAELRVEATVEGKAKFIAKEIL